MEYFRADVKVGVFLFVALLLLVIAAIVVGDLGRWFTPKDTYTVLLPNAHLLHRRALVSYAGLRVGEVTEVVTRSEAERARQHPDYPIALTIAVQAATPLHKNARVEMRTDGFIGDRYLDIAPGDGEVVSPGGTVVGAVGGLEGMLASLSGMQGGLGSLTEAIHTLLADTSQPHSLPSVLLQMHALLDTLTPTLRSLSTEAAEVLQGVKQEITHTSARASHTLQGIDRTIAENRGGLQQVIRELNASLTEARQTLGAMKQFLESGQTDVATLLKSLQVVSENLRHQMDETTSRLNRLLTRTDTILAQNDRNLYITVENLRDLTANLEAASQLLRANPAILLWGNRGGTNGANPAAQNHNQVLQDRGRIGRYDKTP